MNILIDLRPLMAGNVSGVEVYIQSLLKELFLLDQKNQYFLWWNSHQDVEKNIPYFNQENVHYVYTSIPNKILNLSLSFLRYPKIDKWIGRKLNQKINQVLVLDPRPTPISKDCKKIITFHDLSFEHFYKTFSLKSRFWHFLLNPKKEAGESDKIIAVSQATQADLIQTYKVAEDKIVVIYEASSLLSVQEKIQPVKNFSIKEKYELPDKFILTLSTIEPRKNIRGLLQAFHLLKQETHLPHKLVIAGRENEQIFAKVKELKQTDKEVIFIGFVEEKDKPYLYALADVFVYPSFFEGFGLPLVEAMQTGCSIVTSNTSSMPEIVGDAAILVNPYEILSIKEGIQSVLENNKLSKSLKTKGLKRAQKFSWKKCAIETLKVIENCKSPAHN